MYPKLNGFNTKEVTLYTNEAINIGDAVMLSENATAVLPSSGENFCGVCTDKRDNYITVAMTGFAQTFYSGSAPTIGYNKLSADGNGKVKTGDSGREILVAEVDTTNKTISIIL